MISSSCPNLAVQVLNKLLSRKLFDKEIGQYLNKYKEHLKLDKDNVLLKKSMDNTLKKRVEILKNENVKLKKECHLLKDKVLFSEIKTASSKKSINILKNENEKLKNRTFLLKNKVFSSENEMVKINNNYLHEKTALIRKNDTFKKKIIMLNQKLDKGHIQIIVDDLNKRIEKNMVCSS